MSTSSRNYLKIAGAFLLLQVSAPIALANSQTVNKPVMNIPQKLHIPSLAHDYNSLVLAWHNPAN